MSDVGNHQFTEEDERQVVVDSIMERFRTDAYEARRIDAGQQHASVTHDRLLLRQNADEAIPIQTGRLLYIPTSDHHPFRGIVEMYVHVPKDVHDAITVAPIPDERHLEDAPRIDYVFCRTVFSRPFAVDSLLSQSTSRRREQLSLLNSDGNIPYRNHGDLDIRLKRPTAGDGEVDGIEYFVSKPEFAGSPIEGGGINAVRSIADFLVHAKLKSQNERQGPRPQQSRSKRTA
jgi:hypothetical protein